VVPEREIDLDPLFEGGKASAVDPGSLVAREVLVAQVRQGLPPEKRQRRAEELGRVSRILCGASLLDETLEPSKVDLLRPEPDDITRWPGLDHLRPEEFAQGRDVAVQRRRCGLGRVLTPQGVEQLLAPDDLVRPEHEQGQQGALLRTRWRHVVAVLDDLERPQDPNLHRRSKTAAPSIHCCTLAHPGRRQDRLPRRRVTRPIRPR
jgi:hypothetical protein